MSEPKFDDLADTITANFREMKAVSERLEIVNDALSLITFALGLFIIMTTVYAFAVLKSRH